MSRSHAELSPVDVLIIGAGLSGIGAAYYLKNRCPKLSYTIVEARADLGGTWDLFRYPGIRSDSDLFTFGYEFKPWVDENSIADGSTIKAYIAETARENGIDQKIHFHHQVVGTNWISSRQSWDVKIKQVDSEETISMEARWIFNAAGYFRYDKGFTPSFPGMERFEGEIVHPQNWPNALDYGNKRIVVIGSGATAITLVPALAKKASHVILLQRTPSYVLPVPYRATILNRLRPIVGKRFTHLLARRYNIAKQRWVFSFCIRHPEVSRRLIRAVNSNMLPIGYPVDVHFNPPYKPWEQRLCTVPGGDLFKAISNGTATIMTDKIESFTPGGIRLTSGNHIDADLIVTATGLNLNPLGGIHPSVDGVKIAISKQLVYKGMLLSNIPNFAIAVGYTSSSWTLKIGLLCEHFTRLLNFMEDKGLGVCVPIAGPDEDTVPMLNFSAGYVQRSISELPRQGKRSPWTMSWNYAEDLKTLRNGKIDEAELQFSPKLKKS